MLNFDWKKVFAALALATVSAAIGYAQGTQAAPAPPPGAGENRSPMIMPPAAKTALGQKAALMGTLKWSSVPDVDGTGPFPSSYDAAPDGQEYVIFQPKDLAVAKAKGKLGVYVWGSGGCSPDAASSRFHLSEIASHGYVVIVPGKILSGPKAPPQPSGATNRGMPDPASRASAEKMVAGIDLILAENKRKGSPYFGAIDTARIAVAGFSCGGLIALKAGFDPRVAAVLIESSGILKTVPPGAMADIPQMTSLKKDDLAKLHTPVLYILGGPEDIAEPNGLDDFEHVNKVPIFVGDQPGAGHGGLISVPNAEGTKVELDWLDWQLNHDKVAGRTFTGADCVLCRDFRWQVHRKGIQ